MSYGLLVVLVALLTVISGTEYYIEEKPNINPTYVDNECMYYIKKKSLINPVIILVIAMLSAMHGLILVDCTLY